MSIKQLNELIINKGWFLPVTPGSKNITLGGMIVANVHGKNHHKEGSFGNHIEWLDIVTTNGELKRCSKKKYLLTFLPFEQPKEEVCEKKSSKTNTNIPFHQ